MTPDLLTEEKGQGVIMSGFGRGGRGALLLKVGIILSETDCGKIFRHPVNSRNSAVSTDFTTFLNFSRENLANQRLFKQQWKLVLGASRLSL